MLGQWLVRAIVVRCLARFPALDAKARTQAFRLRVASVKGGTAEPSQDQEHLPASARKVLADIQRARARAQRH